MSTKRTPRQQRQPNRDDGKNECDTGEPIYARVANWAVHSVALGIVGTLLSAGIISGNAYLLYDARSALDQIDPVLQDLAARGNEFQRATDMNKVYNQGWNSNRVNMEHLSALLSIVVKRKNDAQLDEDFARSAVDWCTNAIVQLESEQAKTESFLVNDEFFKKWQSISIADYTATIKLIDTLREMILAGKDDTAGKRNNKLEVIERQARDELKTAAAHESLAQQLDAYWNAKMEEDRVKKDHALHQLREIRIKSDLAFAAIIIGIIFLLPSAAIAVRRQLLPPAKGK